MGTKIVDGKSNMEFVSHSSGSGFYLQMFYCKKYKNEAVGLVDILFLFFDHWGALKKDSLRSS